MLKVRDVLKSKSNKIRSISSSTSVFKALEIIGEDEIEALAVTDRGRVVGIFSKHNYVRNKLLHRISLKKTSVSTMMSTPLSSISPEKSVEECVSLMEVTRNNHLPVFEKNRLIGIVSAKDVIQSPK